MVVLVGLMQFTARMWNISGNTRKILEKKMSLVTLLYIMQLLLASETLQNCSLTLEDVDAKGQDGATPLRCAVQQGHARVVEILLSRGATFRDRDEDGLTMLHCAASEGHQARTATITTVGSIKNAPI